MLRARIETTIQPLSDFPDNFLIYFRRTKNAVQSQYEPITADNFEEYLRVRWAKISHLEVTKWRADLGKDPNQVPVFEFFVYKPRNGRNTGSHSNIQRATAARILSARERLQAYEQENNMQIGPIQMQHLATVNARRPDGSNVTIPNDATT